MVRLKLKQGIFKAVQWNGSNLDDATKLFRCLGRDCDHVDWQVHNDRNVGPILIIGDPSDDSNRINPGSWVKLDQFGKLIIVPDDVVKKLYEDIGSE